ncbi:CPCC family cysteine-rich protein [Trinickia sp.]|uniref:CPCC family cysteine-rich protein n=1 Tax=Trinickia sp. TaxID=2571163 RepID=UPI003F7D6B0C
MMREKEGCPLHPCPCCGQSTLCDRGSYEICRVCGWEDDPIQSADPDYAGGANSTSLNEARARWRPKGSN